MDSGGFAVVALENAAELALAANHADRCWHEVGVENCVVAPYSAVLPSFVIVIQPRANDVVDLVSAEANEAVQYFAFRARDEAPVPPRADGA